MFTAACVSVPPLCIVFLDFRSRSARSRSATFKRSSARQSARRLPHRALCALRRITAYLHKPYRKHVYVMRGKISRCFCLRRSVAGFSWILFAACVSVPSFFCGVGVYGVRERAVFLGVGVCFAASAAGFLWILLTACGSVPSFLCGKCFAWGGSGAAHVVGVRFVCGRGWNGRFGAVLSEKRVKKRAFVRFRATLRGGAYNLSQKKSNLCGMRLQADVNVL